MSTGGAIICEPAKRCADPHKYRWYCMRGMHGSPAGVCPLDVCEKRGANTNTEKDKE